MFGFMSNVHNRKAGGDKFEAVHRGSHKEEKREKKRSFLVVLGFLPSHPEGYCCCSRVVASF